MAINENAILLTPTSLDHYNQMTNNLLPYSYYQYAISKDPSIQQDNVSTYCYKVFDLDIHNDIGVVVCYKPKEHSSLWIQSLIVFETFKRQKYGTLIFRKLIRLFLDTSNISSAYLTCYKQNVSGLAFWKALSFKEIHTYTDRKSQDHIIVLKKQLLRSNL